MRIARGFIVAAVIVVGTLASIASSAYDYTYFDDDPQTASFAELTTLRRDDARICVTRTASDVHMQATLEATGDDDHAFRIPVSLTNAGRTLSSINVSADNGAEPSARRSMHLRLNFVSGSDPLCTNWVTVEVGPIAGQGRGTASWVLSAEIDFPDGKEHPDDVRFEHRAAGGSRR